MSGAQTQESVGFSAHKNKQIQASTAQELPGQRMSLSQLRQLAIARQQQCRLDEAVALYQMFLKLQPSDAAIWSNLGAALRKQKQYRSAVNCYRRSLALEPNASAALGNLANALKDLRRLDESLALHQQIIQQKPNDVQSLMNYACALRENAQFVEALRQLDRAQQLDADNAGIEWERAQNLLYLGRYSEGWKAYEARWRTGDLPQPPFHCPQWCGEDIIGKHILLHTEQGYGDTILAARYVKLVKEHVGAKGKVTLQCKPELHRLFQTIGADQLIAPTEMPESIDWHCPLMSLMGCFDTQPDTIPPPAQLHIPEESRQKFAYLRTHSSPLTKGRPGGDLKIGIVWSGSITFKDNDNRALPLSAFLPLAEVTNVRLYSLQKGPRLSELKDNGAEAYIEDIGSRCDDFADTAAAIENLDLIIMTDSSVAHLASTLGKPVINILPEVPYWLYTLDTLKGTSKHKTPWYPSMCFVQRSQFAQWIQSTFSKINDVGIEQLLNDLQQEHSASLQAHVINLDRRTDRWQQFTALNRHYPNIQRRSAVDAETLNVDALVAGGIVHESAREARRSEIACAMSHRAVWLHAVNTNKAQCVFEDDVILREDIATALDDIIAKAPSDWDFILLGCNTDSTLEVEIADGLRMQTRFAQFDNSSKHWRACGEMLSHAPAFKNTRAEPALLKLHHAFGTGGYVVSPQGAQKLLNRCFPLRPQSCSIPTLKRTLTSVALDVILNAHYSTLNAYCAVPPLVLPINDKAQSDIQVQPDIQTPTDIQTPSAILTR